MARPPKKSLNWRLQVIQTYRDPSVILRALRVSVLKAVPPKRGA